MTKQHFIALADFLKGVNELNPGDTSAQFTQTQIDLLANFCWTQNANFKKGRWLSYIAGECGKNGGKVKA